MCQSTTSFFFLKHKRTEINTYSRNGKGKFVAKEKGFREIYYISAIKIFKSYIINPK